MRHDRARGSLDRHATYIVAAYVARSPVVADALAQLRPQRQPSGGAVRMMRRSRTATSGRTRTA